ncbi:MAG TPA: hypothetical protein VNU01_06140, partial [Egibacteraceae bacterium]|nr:hypothetical protein [Egibacteraceae bacterium]
MEALRAAVDGVLSRDPHQLADAELSAELAELRRQADRIEAAFLARLAVFDARRAYADERAANAAVWLRNN